MSEYLSDLKVNHSFKGTYLHYYPVIIISVSLNWKCLKISIISLIATVSGTIYCGMTWYNNVESWQIISISSLSTSVREQELLSLSALQWTQQTDARTHERPTERIIQKSLFLWDIPPVIQQKLTLTQRWKVREGVVISPTSWGLLSTEIHTPHTRSACRPEQQVFLSLLHTASLSPPAHFAHSRAATSA